MSSQMVTLVEITEVTGRRFDDVKAECEALGFFIDTDWALRPAVTADEARALVDGSARRAMEHADAWGAHLCDVKEWDDRRTDTVNAAADEAQEKVERSAMRRSRFFGPSGPPSPGEIASARRDGALHAGKQYERMNPRPSFRGSRDAIHLAFITKDEEGSALAAMVAAVRGPEKTDGIEVA